MTDTSQNEPTLDQQIAALEDQRNEIGIHLFNSANGVANNGSRMRSLKMALPILDDPAHQKIACDALQDTLLVNERETDAKKKVAPETAAGAAKAAKLNVAKRLVTLKAAKKAADETAAQEKAAAEKARKAASKARAA